MALPCPVLPSFFLSCVCLQGIVVLYMYIFARFIYATTQTLPGLFTRRKNRLLERVKDRVAPHTAFIQLCHRDSLVCLPQDDGILAKTSSASSSSS